MRKGKQILCSILSLALLWVLAVPARAETPQVKIVWLPEGVEPVDTSTWSVRGPVGSKGIIGMYVSPVREVKKGDLVAVSRKGEYGYMDLKGELVIPLTDYSTFAVLKYFFFFSDGLLPVPQQDDKDNTVGTHYVDKSGKTVLTLDDGSLALGFSDGVALVSRPDSWGERKLGAINTKGETVVPFEYDDVSSYSLGFVNGFAQLRKRNADGKMEPFFVSADGKTEISLAEYDEAFWFSEGLAAVTKDGKRGYIDTTGKLKVPCIYDESNSAREFQNGFAVVCKDEKYGYINTAGEEIVPVEFVQALPFNQDGVGYVCTADGFYYIDGTGKQTEYMSFPQAAREKLSDGGYEIYYLIMKDGAWVTKDGKMGFADMNGDIVIPLEYDPPWEENASNLAYFPIFRSGLALVRKDGKYGYINKKGETVVPFESEANINLGLIMGGYVGVVYKDGRYGIFENPYYEEPKAPSVLDGLLGGNKGAGTSGSAAAPGSGFPVLPAVGGIAAVAALGGGLVLLKKKKRG